MSITGSDLDAAGRAGCCDVRFLHVISINKSQGQTFKYVRTFAKILFFAQRWLLVYQELEIQNKVILISQENK